jgi:very-short-patch-repair endonuclease
VDPDVKHPEFDSLFEQRVFLELVTRGFHVTPQVESNGRRIDLVVTGEGAKLAVECDGDHWHSSPEQLEQDLYREQELKRCGWTFWRVRESAYYLDKSKALDSLWSTLASLGIKPILTASPTVEASVPAISVNTAETAILIDVVPDHEEPPIEGDLGHEEVDEVASGDATWLDIFPWLRSCAPGRTPELDVVSEVEGWWLSSTPQEIWTRQGASRVASALGNALLARWPEDQSLAKALPTLPAELKLDHLSFGTRARNILRIAGIETAADLGQRSYRDLLDVRSVGRRTVLDLLATVIEAAVEPPAGVGGGPTLDSLELPALTAAVPNEPIYDDPLTEINSWFAVLRERDIRILAERFFAEEPKTLEDVGAEFGVTRERIRQIESKLKTRLFQQLGSSAQVSELLDRVREKIQPVASLQRLLSDFPVLGERADFIGKPLWLVLDKLDDYFEVVEGWALAPSASATREHTSALLDDLNDEHGVVRFDVVQRVVADAGMSPEELRSWLGWCGYRFYQDVILAKSGSYLDVAAGILSVVGKPMQVENLAAEMEQVGNVRGLADRLGGDSRFQRVDRGAWALAEWGLDEYTTIKDQVRRAVDGAGGSIDVIELIQSLTSRFHNIAESSIRAYAAAGEFETRDGVVSRRIEQSRVSKTPAETRRLYRHGSGWRYRLIITSDHLRGSGFQLPSALAATLGVSRGGTVELDSDMGSQVVRWTGLQPACATIRRFLERQRVELGSTVFLEFTDGRRFTVIPAAPEPAGGAALATAIWLIGGSDVHLGDAASTLSAAIDLPADAKPRAILRAYRARGDHEVVEALERAWLNRQTSEAG